MAEEIRHEWPYPNLLVMDAMGLVPSGAPLSTDKARQLLADPANTATYKFRFLDADGREVRFPLRLVSDTRINPSVPASPGSRNCPKRA